MQIDLCKTAFDVAPPYPYRPSAAAYHFSPLDKKTHFLMFKHCTREVTLLSNNKLLLLI